MSCLSPVVKGTWYSVYFFVGADLFQVVFSCRIIPVLQQGWAVCSHSSTQEDWSGSLFQKQHFPTPQKCRNEVLVVPVGIFSFLSPLWYLNMKCKFLKFSFKHLRCLQRCIGPEVRYVRNKTQWDMLLRDNNQERGGVTLPGTKRSYCKTPPIEWSIIFWWHHVSRYYIPLIPQQLLTGSFFFLLFKLNPEVG